MFSVYRCYKYDIDAWDWLASFENRELAEMFARIVKSGMDAVASEDSLVVEEEEEE